MLIVIKQTINNNVITLLLFMGFKIVIPNIYLYLF